MRKACGKRESVAAAQVKLVKLVKLVNKVFHDSLQNREASRSTTCQEHPRSKKHVLNRVLISSAERWNMLES
jgi:hypothetical protein